MIFLKWRGTSTIMAYFFFFFKTNIVVPWKECGTTKHIPIARSSPISLSLSPYLVSYRIVSWYSDNYLAYSARFCFIKKSFDWHLRCFLSFHIPIPIASFCDLLSRESRFTISRIAIIYNFSWYNRESAVFSRKGRRSLFNGFDLFAPTALSKIRKIIA